MAIILMPVKGQAQCDIGSFIVNARRGGKSASIAALAGIINDQRKTTLVLLRYASLR
jgi:hypothetical protein